MIPIYKPYLTQKNLEFAHEALNSGWISSQGKYLDLAKNLLKEKINYNKVILTNNGTTATHLLSIALKYKYPHIKKIIVPNNVYVAAWNSFLFDKNYQLITVDADLDTWNFDLSKLDTLVDDESAILVVHNVGNVVNVPELQKRFPKTVILEDNCEGFLGKYNNDYTGTKSFASSISFFGNKTITSGEGGAFITNDDEVFDYINLVKNQGQSDTRFVHDVLGYNYRMTNVQAALLYGQLLDLDTIIDMKNKVLDEYKKNLNQVEEISFQKIEDNTQHSNWMFGIRFNKFTLQDKRNLELSLFEFDIDSRPMFYDINKHKHLSDIKNDNTNSKLLQDQCLILPSFPELSQGQIVYVCEKIKKFIKKNK